MDVEGLHTTVEVVAIGMPHQGFHLEILFGVEGGVALYIH